MVSLKRVIAVGTVALVAVMAAPAGARADGGTAGAGSDSSGPLGHQVRGSGTWAVGVGGNNVKAPFHCAVSATGPAITSNIRPPDQDGCVLRRNGVVVSRALGGVAPGPTYATAQVGDMAFLGTTSVQVCWRVWSGFNDGDLQENASCTSVSLL